MYNQPGNPNCPVVCSKLYLSKLNSKLDVFLQKPNMNQKINGLWHVNAPLGIHMIGNLMKTISGMAGTSKIYTNHWLKATTTTVFERAGIHATDIYKVQQVMLVSLPVTIVHNVWNFGKFWQTVYCL